MANREALFIGIDGGGSTCRAAARWGGASPVEVYRSGPANVTSDFPGAITTISDLIRLAAQGAGVRAIHLGLAGVTGAAIAAQVETVLAGRFPGARIRATGDQITMLAGAHGDRTGAVAAVGTGSFVIRQTKGRIRHAGGRGLILGDQASGGWLGLRLLQEVMLAHDGLRLPTDLSRAISARYRDDPAEIIAFARDARPADIAALAPDVLAAAEADDPIACGLMREGSAYLVRALAAVGFAADEPLCLTGGLGSAYAAWLPDHIARRVIPARGSALDGALFLAEQGVS